MEQNKNKTTTTPDATIDSNDAARLLTDLLGGTPTQWITWLSNDRRRSRRLLPVPGPGRARYLLDAVRAHADVELRRRRHAEAGRRPGRGACGPSVTILAGTRPLAALSARSEPEDGSRRTAGQDVTMEILASLIAVKLAPGAAWKLGSELCAAAAEHLPGGTPEVAHRGQP